MGGMMGGGGGGGSAPAPDYGSGNGGVGYTAPQTVSPYQASYQPTTATPALQSVLGQQTGQTNSLGLPSLQSMFNLPQRSAPQAGGIQQLATMQPYVGSTYRPDMSAINANLNNVAPSVQLQQQRAAEAEAARLAAEEAEAPQDNYYNWRTDPYAGG